MTEDSLRLKDIVKGDILKVIKEYAGCYTPEWDISYENPDAGTAIAMIFAEQVMGNIESYNGTLNRYHKAFTNMEGMSLRPPGPSKSTVIVKLIDNTVHGVFMEAGTKFTASDEEGREIIFESCSPAYITESRIDTVFMVSRRGEYRFILGEYKKPAAGECGYEVIRVNRLREFPLFNFEYDSVRKKEVYIYHNYIFKGEKDLVRLNIAGGEELLKGIDNKKFGIYYYAEGKMNILKDWQTKGEDIVFVSPKDESGIDMVMVRAEENVENDIYIDNIFLSSEGGLRPPQFVCSDTKDLAVEEFAPFGEMLSVWSQCYIGCDGVFSKKGSVITLKFGLDYGSYRTGVRERKEELKIIKRRDYRNNEYLNDAYADEVSFEYYTGKGWKRLDIPSEYLYIFGKGIKADISITFRCPEDWKDIAVGAYEGKCIRIQVTKSENCYLQPCIHHYPVISNMEFSYSYQDIKLLPDRIECISGMVKKDLTEVSKQGQQLLAFQGDAKGVTDRLYIGFDKAVQGGPVGLWIQKKYDNASLNRRVFFLYYGKGGFKRLKVIDNTENLSHSGTVLFIPPADMEKKDLYGRKRYCICIESSGECSDNDEVTDIQFNGIDVMNIETEREQDFYIDVAEPGMEFFIDCNNLLDIDVWVNENGSYTKWRRTDNFDSTDDKKVYVLNRSENKIIFGDGAGKEIPKVTGDIAFKVVAYRCMGALGNVGKNRINDTRSNILYVDSVNNPAASYGGSNTETMDMWFKRGAGLISSHGRLVTEKDYIREIRGFSDCIDKVRCIQEGGDITVILLMKDYKEGHGSFYRIRDELSRYIADRCDILVSGEQIHIKEPLFVEVSVSVWLITKGVGDEFELTGRIKEGLNKYLDPVTGRDGTGWEPGVFPEYSRIVMKINTLKKDSVVKRVLVTASYTDRSGRHECSMENIMSNPTAVVRNGEHKVYTHCQKGEM